MLPRLVLDTHIVLRWLGNSKRLSRAQFRALENAAQRAQPVALSAISLLEIAMLAAEGKVATPLDELFEDMQRNPMFRILPLTYEIASEAGSFGWLGDPADRTIVATARVHRVQLVTSDQRIIQSKLVPVVE